jgi:hypothetical protein
MNMNLTREVLLNEIQTAKKILEGWESKLENIPKYDRPGSDDDVQRFFQSLIAELMLVSGKCDTLATILGGGA